MFETLQQNVNVFADESLREVWNWLRPATDGYEMKKYKTNQKNATYEIGNKVIKFNMVDAKFGGGYHVNYYHEKYLIALDKVFHMLDGKSIMGNSYRSPLVDAINGSTGARIETSYFGVTMHKNRNAHIEFIRADLLSQFNARMGGMNLRGAK